MSKDDKKNKKKLQLRKNRKLHDMLQGFRQIREEDTRVKEQEKEQRARKSEVQSEEEVWSAKVATIRNRLTDQKRHSKERWNRFSGTGDEGGRGL